MIMENNNIFDWDSEINNESSDFVLLPEGDYDFTVEKFERGQFDGSDKMPACKKAIVTLTIWGADDKISITENFMLCEKMEWKLSSLFLSLGLKKHGEPLKMNWSAVTGARGRCHVFVDNYKKKDDGPGEITGKSNKIKKFYAYDENVTTVKPNAKPTSSPAPAAGGWVPGKF
jgi:hypothetical protein